MDAFARARKVGLERVRALYRLQVPPITKTVSGIMSSLLVDRLALSAGCLLALAIVALLGFLDPKAWLGAGFVLAAWVLGHRQLEKRRTVDAVPFLALRARSVASIFDAPFIVMGHTHVPERQRLRDSVTYINVGSWAEDEPDEGEHALRAPRSHLVIQPGEAGPVARFLRWDRVLGPTDYDPADDPPLPSELGSSV